MEKKEYQSPKMEVVEMPCCANLLGNSGSLDSFPVDIEPSEEDCDEDC